MSLRIFTGRLGLPSELALIQPLTRRSLALSRPKAARQAPGVSTSPSQETPRLTLNVSGNGFRSSARDASGDGMGARAHVGPFPMGVGMDSVVRKGASKPWRELSLGSKVARVGQKSTSLLVVATGGLLFFLIATSVGTELFSPNSSTVIFGRVVDLLQENEDLKLYLIPPFTFHPPHQQTTRQASNTRMSLQSLPSQVSIDRSTGVETHTFGFLIEGQSPGDYRSPTGWFGSAKAKAVDGVKQTYAWAKEELEEAGLIEKTTEAELKLAAEAAKAAASVATASSTSAGLGSWLGGLVGLRRDGAGGRAAQRKRKGVPELGTFTTGECHVRCEKNPQTHRLEIKKIDVSVPSRSATSTFTRPYRFAVPVPDDSDAGWLKTLGDWWEGEAGEEAPPAAAASPSS